MILTWQWVIVVVGLALIYSTLFYLALKKVVELSVQWAKETTMPYRPEDFKKIRDFERLPEDSTITKEHETLISPPREEWK